MEHKIAVWMVNKLQKSCPREGIERIKLEYGMEVLIDNLLKGIVILSLAAMTGVLKESSFVFLGFVILRLQAGGSHCSTNVGCWFFTTLIIVGGGLLTHYMRIPKNLAIILLIFSLIIVVRYAPSGTANNPILPKYRKRMRITSILVVTVYLVIAVCDVRYGIGEMFAVGTISEAVSLLPLLNRKYQKTIE